MRMSLSAMLLACAATAATAASPPANAPMPSVPYAFIASMPDTADYYPSASRSLGEQGTVSLVLCYDQNGKPVEVRMVKSSGFPRIDAAAVRWGKAVRIKPGTASGEAQPGCVFVPAEFSLESTPKPPGQAEGVVPPPAIVWPPLPPSPPPPVKLIPLGGN